MTGFKGTPGPYKAEPVDMFGDYNIVRANCEDEVLAIAAVVSNMRPSGEVAANAALVAAAPDLLEALQGLVNAVFNDDVAATVSALVEARAAIRRALSTPASEGEE